ncbi:XRE family transcriptional regulator [Macrococcoides goetzii]|uniref:XRE family transcriptional regulator n=1 Tax=Macrococcoides goetzii TaxID=1891097 RepID=A0A395GB66_9STAP|nr:helix-turn-helix domain-containing protein [Macrococcus goetzii]RAI81266.1 XRE family transcriptional regulator [Macrococcus goetzii]
MIRNRLAELMQSKGIKVVQLSKETGISRNTITNTVQNDSEMYRLDTINKICNTLKITPCDFFEYSPIEIEIEVSHDPEILHIGRTVNESYIADDINLELDIIFTLIKDGRTKNVYGTLKYLPQSVITTSPIHTSSISYSLDMNENQDNINELSSEVNNLSSGFKSMIYKKMINEIKTYLINYSANIEYPFYTTYLINFDVEIKDVVQDVQIEVISNVFTKF